MARPRTVEVGTPLPERTLEVEVVARVADGIEGKLSSDLRALPPGTLSNEDIDRRTREERDSWS
jgi:hypothetical protein